jgi:Na+:H+ antiporter, NhaC family
MGDTVFLVLCAMSFGGVMEHTGMLMTLAERLLRVAQRAGTLVVTTVLTSVGINVVAADQYIAIVVPGRMYAGAYRRMGLHAKNLSRAIEDGGTITSPLVPWNTCGAFMAGTLMVPTGAYFAYAFLNLLNPLIAILYGLLGWSLAPLDDDPPASTIGTPPGDAPASSP